MCNLLIWGGPQLGPSSLTLGRQSVQSGLKWMVASFILDWFVFRLILLLENTIRNPKNPLNSISRHKMCSRLIWGTLNPFVPTVAISQLSSNICCPRDLVSRTANVETVGTNGLIGRTLYREASLTLGLRRRKCPVKIWQNVLFGLNRMVVNSIFRLNHF